MVALISLFGVLSFVLIFVFLIRLIIRAIRKRPIKKTLLIFAAAIVVFAICVAVTPDTDDDTLVVSSDDEPEESISVEEPESGEEEAEPESEESSEEEKVETSSKDEESDKTEANEDDGEDASAEEQESNIIESLVGIGYTEDEAEAMEVILTNVGILDCDDMWIILDNDPLKACALEYNDHQVNFTTEDNVLFYVQITGWEEEISGYGWYRNNWNGKLTYKYDTSTKINSVDLYSVDSDGSGGYYAVYDAETDSVSPYD